MMQAQARQGGGKGQWRVASADGWRLVTCPGGKEAAAVQILARLGYTETFYPVRLVDARPRSKRARATCTEPRRIERAWVPGYVFVRCRSIDMFRVCRLHGRIPLRVIAPRGVPYRVSDAEMAAMAQVPDRVRHMVEAAKAAEAAAWVARQPVVGRQARITRGPFIGRQGVVVWVEGHTCTLDLGLPITVPLMWAERPD